MGQYFKAINLDKKEYVCPWCLGGGAKLWEWAANPQGSIFTLLLRKSSEGGGGDFFGYHKGYGEGSPVPDDLIAGRWAGDRVCLAGDYDESRRNRYATLLKGPSLLRCCHYTTTPQSRATRFREVVGPGCR